MNRGWYVIKRGTSTGSTTGPLHCHLKQERLRTQRQNSAELRGANRQTNIKSRGPNMRALLLLPLLLCAALCLVQVRAEMKAVKLCGREFLRAVVYTCGGSRWRRVLTESDGDGWEQSSLESSQLSRRDSSMLTTVCCQVGCRKSDLTFLC